MTLVLLSSTTPARLAMTMAVAVAAGLAGTAPAAGTERPTRIEFVEARGAPAPKPDRGLLVLDLAGLESPEAARLLAQAWRQLHGAAPDLTCWLQGPSRDEAAQALAELTQATPPPCSRILVRR